MVDRLGPSLSENLITVLCHDDTAGKIVASLANPDLFEGDYRVIAERAIAYWTKHKRAPATHTPDLVADILDDKNNRKAVTYRRILRSMLHLADGMNTDYIVEQLRKFSRVQHMKDGILKAAERLNSKQEMAIDEVEELLSDLLRARETGFDEGIRLTDVSRIMNYLEFHYSEFRTGIEPLDRRNIVPARSEAMLFLAPTGRGKTWFLCHIGKHALLQRKKVLHVTLELEAELVGQRYYQMLFAIPKHRGSIPTTRLKLTKTGKVEDFRRIKIKPGVTLDDSERVLKVLNREVGKFKHKLHNLVIKRFPQRSLSMSGLRAFLDTLESQGFIPDMVILDYIGITQTDVRNPRATLGRAFEEFRGIMQERNMAGVTAHQVSKEGAKAARVRSTHAAEDWSLIHTSDITLTYSCTDAEDRLGLARIGVDKARNERDKFEVIITQSYTLGQFVLQAAMMNRVYRDYVADMREEIEEEWNVRN